MSSVVLCDSAFIPIFFIYLFFEKHQTSHSDDKSLLGPGMLNAMREQTGRGVGRGEGVGDPAECEYAVNHRPP